MYRLSVAIRYTVGPEQPVVRERPVMLVMPVIFQDISTKPLWLWLSMELEASRCLCLIPA
jgi:hypothetical protein